MMSLGREPQETGAQKFVSRGAATDRKQRQRQSSQERFVMIDSAFREQHFQVVFDDGNGATDCSMISP